jgi:hypothetical protein
MWFRIVYIVVVAGYAALMLIDPIVNEPRRLVSMGGFFVFVAILFIFSRNPSKVFYRNILKRMLNHIKGKMAPSDRGIYNANNIGPYHTSVGNWKNGVFLVITTSMK